jgi:hypothetical protein
MNKLLLLTALVLVLSASAWAAPCQPGPYSSYFVSGFSCTIDNLTFSNFSFSASANPSGIAIPASAINVTPFSGPFFEGFTFSSGWNVGTQSGGVSSFQDNLLDYTVTSPTASITDAHLSFNGSFTGTGLTGVTENFCLNSATVNNCPAGSAGQLHVTNPPPKFDDNVVFFPPVNMISVTKDITVSSGVNGTASISSVVNIFTQQTPEPGTFLLLGSALLGVGLLRKRALK